TVTERSSYPPETRRLPSGENAAQSAMSWALIFIDSLPDFTSQRRSVPSSLADSSLLPSGEKQTVGMPPACPVNVPISLPVPRFHNRMDRSAGPLAHVAASPALSL